MTQAARISILRSVLIAIAFFNGIMLFAQPNLLGVLTEGGPNGAGTLFSIDVVTQTLQVKHAFSNADGASPYGTLLYASNGMYYGTTTLVPYTSLRLLLQLILS